MSTEALPTSLDVRRLAARSVTVSGVLQPCDLPRLRSLLAGDEGSIRVDMEFLRDEEHRYLIHLVVRADLLVNCQRCLEVMYERVHADVTLAVLWSEDQAMQLPRHLDPLVVAEQNCQVWDLVEEELMLSMPSYSYHDRKECRQTDTAYADDSESERQSVERENPFNVLAQLRAGEGNQEH